MSINSYIGLLSWLADAPQGIRGPEPGGPPGAEPAGDEAAGQREQERDQDGVGLARRRQVNDDALGAAERAAPCGAIPGPPGGGPASRLRARPSPTTWATTRRVRQPIAFSVPNSRTRRE